MARYTGPKHKLSRREGRDLFGTGSASLQRRLNVPPGQAPTARRKKVSEYGLQLREKQAAKRMFGILEKQFRRYFELASRQRGTTGEALLQLLERRLDNVVYRLGFARTRPMARQLVAHGHVLVDSKKVDIPSYAVKAGDTIQLDQKALQMPVVQETMEDMAGAVPQWLAREGPAGRVLRLPRREEMEPSIKEELIIAFYSR
ncbi:MAG: 30S ribosomal protein S4 [Chloroflexi bacterium]|nr:30S ribosomal protein S4 [Chloroflexota bacterium]